MTLCGQGWNHILVFFFIRTHTFEKSPFLVYSLSFSLFSFEYVVFIKDFMFSALLIIITYSVDSKTFPNCHKQIKLLKRIKYIELIESTNTYY